MIRTLIVEDDPMVAQLNQHYLERVCGFEFVANAGTVNEAILQLAKYDIDLILLDSYMPEKNGFELLKYLRQHELNIDVIYITAARDMESIKRAIQYGVVDYLIKPFTFQRFNEALNAHRKRMNLMKESHFFDQNKLDTILLDKESKLETKEIPKGLTKKTLRRIWDTVLVIEEELFTAEEVSKLVGLSRVSIGKYLHFLEDEGILQVKIEYGQVGRPMTKYLCVDKNKDKQSVYLD